MHNHLNHLKEETLLLPEREHNAPPHLSEALISLENLRHNISEVKNLVGHACKVMAIVKANAYSHTIEHIAPTLLQEGIMDFGVANIHEAIQLRQIVGKNPLINILAFASPIEGQLESYVRHNIKLCIGDLPTFIKANSIAEKVGKKIDAHLKIDTGMGRFGVHPKDALHLASLIEESQNVSLEGIFTHFSSSDSDKSYTKRQLQTYKTIVALFEDRYGRKVLKHTANSGAVVAEKESYFDMVRPGILLYGYKPKTTLRSPLSLKPVMQLQAKVVFVKTVERGSRISYGQTWKAPHQCRIATIAIGYYDGYHRGLSNKASVFINGKAYPQVGSVTMDAIMVNLGDDISVQVGDSAVLFGWSENMGANYLSDKEGGIVYELLCSVSPRVKRVAV